MAFDYSTLIRRVHPNISRIAVRIVEFGNQSELKAFFASVWQNLRPNAPPLFTEEWRVQPGGRIYNSTLGALQKVFVNLMFYLFGFNLPVPIPNRQWSVGRA